MVARKLNRQNLTETKTEGVRMLQFLRALGSEDQRIAYAILEGMNLQRKLDGQRSAKLTAES